MNKEREPKYHKDLKAKNILNKSKYENIFMNSNVYIETRQTFHINQIWREKIK